MTTIRKYEPRDLDAVVAIFRSNIPKYFGPSEEAGLHDFLRDYSDDYYVLEVDDAIVGAGGIALNGILSRLQFRCVGEWCGKIILKLGSARH